MARRNARERLEAEYAGARNIFDGRHADRNVASRGRARQQIQTMFGRHHAPVPWRNPCNGQTRDLLSGLEMALGVINVPTRT